jgi:adenylate cyclase
MQEPAFSTAVSAPRSCAILAAGVDGALDPADRDEVLKRLAREIRSAAGTIVSVAGQSVMAEFDMASEAFTCALRMQAQTIHVRSVRVGIASDEADALALQPGAVVILAQQLRAVAPAGGIALPSALYAQLSDLLSLPVTHMAQPILGELPEPVAVVTISAADCEAWSRQGDPTDTTVSNQRDDRLTLAMVPFRVASSQVAGFADAATDDVIRLLGGASRWIGVARVPLPSNWGAVDLRQVRQTCDARYIMHGSAEQERGTLRLTVELNEAATGRVLWSDRFDNAHGDVGALRDICAPRIAGAAATALVQRELDRTESSPLGGLSVQAIALRALARIMQPERATFSSAGESLRTALLRPGPAPGSVLYVLTIWHMMAIGQGWSDDPAADAQAAIALSERLDRNDPASLALVGYVQAVLHRDHTLAFVTLDRVIDQAPFCAAAWTMKARVLVQMGEGEEAVFHAEQAEALPTLGFDRAWRSSGTALAYYAAERYVDAVRWAKLAAMHHGGLAMTFRVLAASLVVLGQLDEAQQAAQRVLAINPGFRIGNWRLRSMLTADLRERYAQRLWMAGLPE